jgi:glycosyltransferase involved in cell wall biosynthesis
MIEILLATYNGEKYLSQQINSILSQTYQQWKLLIHDDGSTDKTVEIIKNFEYKYPNKIVYVNDKLETGSARDNFAYLLSLSKAKYIMFCDQDDVWEDDKIEVTIFEMLKNERANRNKPILIHSDLCIVDENLQYIHPSMWDYQRTNPKWSQNLNISLVQNSITGCTIMINDIAKNISLPIPKYAIMHDWWILASVLKNNGVVSYIEQPLIKYRQHSSNEVGAKRFSIFNLLRKITTINKYKLMANELKIKISLFYIVYLKTYIILKRMLGIYK